MNEDSKNALRLYLSLASSEEIAILTGALNEVVGSDMARARFNYSAVLYEILYIVRAEYHGRDLRPEMFFDMSELSADG